MLTQYEASKVQADMRRELEGRPSVLWTCVAGLLIVMAVTLIGIVEDTPQGRVAALGAVAHAGQPGR